VSYHKGLLSFAVKKKQYIKLHNYAKLYIYVPDVDTQTYCVLLLSGTYVYVMALYYDDTDFIVQIWNFIAHSSTNKHSESALPFLDW